jgi:hypothetical protein
MRYLGDKSLKVWNKKLVFHNLYLATESIVWASLGRSSGMLIKRLAYSVQRYSLAS